jgi:hypothetical protein
LLATEYVKLTGPAGAPAGAVKRMQQEPLPQLGQLACGTAVPWLGGSVIASDAQLMAPQVVVAGMQISTVPPAQTEAVRSGAAVWQTVIVTVPVPTQAGVWLLAIV